MYHLTKIQQKIVSSFELEARINGWREKGESIVFTNGCFDLLHKGHIEYLAKTADLGDNLIIGLNSDASVKMLEKGDLRPIKEQETRAIILASLEFVKAVVVFNEETPLKLIKTVLPDVLVKGGDWNLEQIVGADIVTKNGGEVKTVSFVDGFSTTNYVEKIQNG